MRQKLNCILLIDDDEPTNFMSKILLEDAYCTNHIQIADSGKKALSYLSATNPTINKDNEMPYPELIFLDINMPAMNGWEFLDKLKEIKTEKEPEIVIIMLTTSINPDDKLKAEKMPLVDGFENKPITSEIIKNVINKYFNNKDN
jgi:CheY-like chemotaxis protein